jgi:hypothetical protein
MNRINELGAAILEAQARLGLSNPIHTNNGIPVSAMTSYDFLHSVFRETELPRLFAWRNGVTNDGTVPMSELWICPGFFLLSASEVEAEHEYYAAHIEVWKPDWYPLLADGTADRLFVDSRRTQSGLLPVFYAFWSSARHLGQIYDSVELMLETFLRCYESGTYHRDPSGMLCTLFSQEVETARILNPNSDYWKRKDLVLH